MFRPSRCFDVACDLHDVGVLIGPVAGREQFGPHTMADRKRLLWFNFTMT